jgi:hypothetical protein
MERVGCLFLVLLAGCTAQLEERSFEHAPEKTPDMYAAPDHPQETTSPVKFTGPVFDHFAFIAKANSFLSSLTKDKIELSTVIDTAWHEGYRCFGHLKPVHGSQIVSFKFHPGKKHAGLRFRIAQAFYKDTIALREEFKELRHDAKGIRKKGETFSPGLTATNDYLIRTRDRIYWLNIPCGYSEKSKKQIRALFMSSLSVSTVKDSIICDCGDAFCN